MIAKQGFTLVELMLGLMFGGMLASVLFTLFFQLNLTTIIGNNLIDIDTKLAIFHHQLERDLAGTCIPQVVVAQEQEKKQTAQQEKKGNAKSEGASPEKKEQKKTRKSFEKPYYCSNKDGRLDMITFITNNPLRAYKAEDPGSQMAQKTPGLSRTCRVTYQLIPDVRHQDAFTLTRRESPQLDLQSNEYKGSRAYELIDNIKTINFSFLRPIAEKKRSEKKEGDKKKDAQKEKETPVDYATYSSWPPEQGAIELPHIVICSVTLWDNAHERTRTVKFYAPYLAMPQLFPREQEEPEEKKQEKELQASAETAAQTGAGQPQQPPVPPEGAGADKKGAPQPPESTGRQNSSKGPVGSVTPPRSAHGNQFQDMMNRLKHNKVG